MPKDMLIIDVKCHFKQYLNQANLHPFANSFCYFRGQFGNAIFEPNQFSSTKRSPGISVKIYVHTLLLSEVVQWSNTESSTETLCLRQMQ